MKKYHLSRNPEEHGSLVLDILKRLDYFKKKYLYSDGTISDLNTFKRITFEEWKKNLLESIEESEDN